MIRIGVDVGGTNTDAVLMEGNNVLASFKCQTTEDVSQGISNAIAQILCEGSKSHGIEPFQVQAVMIGTTHFLNALLQRKGLSKVAIFRLCGPATHSMPPLQDWPMDLRNAVEGYVAFCKGGYEYDGSTTSTIDEQELVVACKEAKSQGITCGAVTGVFSNVNPDQEEAAATIIERELGECTASSSLSGVLSGLIARENAAVLNATLRPQAQQIVAGLETALERCGLGHSQLFLTQNDGTLLSCAAAAACPARTFAGGAANSLRGAAFLSGVADALVVDVGGTSTDVGALRGGLARQAGVEVEVIPGIVTNSHMPDIYSCALGGGTIVELSGDKETDFKVGIESVGYTLKDRAVCFGGDTLTTTDFAVYLGTMNGIGEDRSKLEGLLGNKQAQIIQVQEVIKRRIENAIDRIKVSAAPEPVVLVGGGAALLPAEGARLRGAAGTARRPPHADVANAVGAAIAQVSGEATQVLRTGDKGGAETATAEGRRAVVAAAATKDAVNKGAMESTVCLVEYQEIQMAYIPGGAVRAAAKVVGDLGIFPSQPQLTTLGSPECGVPNAEGDWIVTEEDIHHITLGAGLLGCGGGGSPAIGSAVARRMLLEGKEIRVISPYDRRHL
ncbi:unnamed protein product, partial [Heterosigma akashiwo]